MARRLFTIEEKLGYVERIKALVASGMKQEEACAKEGIPMSNFIRWRVSPVDHRTRAYAKAQEAQQQVVIYKPEAKPEQEKKPTKAQAPAPQMTLVMGTVEQISELLRGRS